MRSPAAWGAVVGGIQSHGAEWGVDMGKEKTRTVRVVPPTERAVDDEDSLEIEEIFSLLSPGENAPACKTGGLVTGEGTKSRCEDGLEVPSSGIFRDRPLDMQTSRNYSVIAT